MRTRSATRVVATPELLARVMPVVPDRMARQASGAVFHPEHAGCLHPERIARLAALLHWMTPLEVLGKDDQRLLGLLNSQGRPVHAGEPEDEADEAIAPEASPSNEPSPLLEEPALA